MAPTVSSGLTPASHGQSSGGGSSAPVLEFVCLFTHDLRRKQKRWQDGRIKYHLFNKRVMVYDDRGNFVGDLYWARDWEFDEGEEVETERGGVIVQVAECVGRQNQDLSELLDKRAKEKEQRAAARPAVPPVPMHTPLSISRTPIQREHLQARHRPLHQLLGTPSGHHGRAVVPTESPYEQRHTPGQTPDGRSNPQASKKRRYDDSPSIKTGYAQSLFGTQLSLEPMSSAPIRRPAVSRLVPQVDVCSSAEGSEDARPADVMDKSNYRSDTRVDPTDSRKDSGRAEPTSREQGNIAPTKASTRIEPGTPSVDTERRDVQQPGYTSSRRGVSSHFSHASNESQGRAALLRDMGMGMGIKAGLSKDISTAMAERRYRNVNEVEVRQQAEPEPEPAIVLDEEVEDQERDSTRLPDRHEVVARRKRDPPEPQNQPNAKRKKDLGQLVSPLVAQTNSEADIPTVQGPGTATGDSAVTEVPKERRTELRLKSRQKRGLLVAAEMANKPKVKKTKKKRLGPETSLRNSEEPQQGDLHEQLDEEMLEIPARPGPVSPDPVDDDPFASPPKPPRAVPSKAAPQSASNGQRAKKQSTKERDLAEDEDDDPFASMPNSAQAVPSKPAPQSAHNPRAKRKSTKEKDVADNEDADEPLDTRSPEPAKRSKVVDKRPKLKSMELVYDISDDTADEDEPLQRERTAKSNSKNPDKNIGKGPSAEEVGSEPEHSPPTRRASRRNAGKNSHAEKPEKGPRGRSNKKRQLSESASPEESAQEELLKAPARPRVVKLSRKSVKSREVFGFAPSSSPPPPAFGPGSPPAPPISQKANDRIPTLDIDEDIVNKTRSAPAVTKPDETPTNPRRNMPPTSVPSLQPRNSISRADKGKMEAAVVSPRVPARPVQPPDGELNREGLACAPSTVQAVGRTAASVNMNRPMVPTVSGPQTLAPRNEIAASVEKNVSQDEQPGVHAKERHGLHVESHNTANSPQLQPTAIITRPGQALSGADGPTRPRPVPAEMPPVAGPAPVLPKIVNPASRGRKAALKSDAAGQTPQSILPPVEPNLLARAAVRPGAVAAGVEERPKLKMTFPGFVSAKETGPWSRESDDLFESGRPS